VFYRGMHAFVVGRLIGDGSLTPLVLAFTNSVHGRTGRVRHAVPRRCRVRCSAMRAPIFHVDLPVVSAAITLAALLHAAKAHRRTLHPCSAAPNRARQNAIFALQRHLDKSIDSFVHAPGERGLVMIVFTLPSHDLVFKVIRDRFGAPKTSTREDVMERYQFVFRHDPRRPAWSMPRSSKRLRLPRAALHARPGRRALE